MDSGVIMKQLLKIIPIFYVIALLQLVFPCFANQQSMIQAVVSGVQEPGCAGGADGYIGRTDAEGTTTGCNGTCTTNYLYYSKFVVETDASQEDGTITYAHWDTDYLTGGTRAGIWNTSGDLVVGTAEQTGNDGHTNAYNVGVTETCLAAGTYYTGVWVQGDAWANAIVTGWTAGQWTRIVTMATFGNIGSDPETAGTEHAANAELVAWFNNTSGR